MEITIVLLLLGLLIVDLKRYNNERRIAESREAKNAQRRANRRSNKEARERAYNTAIAPAHKMRRNNRVVRVN
jgi:hypothetical protein